MQVQPHGSTSMKPQLMWNKDITVAEMYVILKTSQEGVRMSKAHSIDIIVGVAKYMSVGDRKEKYKDYFEVMQHHFECALSEHWIVL